MADRDWLPPTIWSDAVGEPPWSVWRRNNSPARWPRLALYKKALILVPCAAAAVTAAWELAFHTSGTERVLAVVCGLLLAGWLIRIVRWREEFRHNRDWVRPLDLKLPPDVIVKSLTRDRSQTVLALPPGRAIDAKEQDAILAVAAATLDLPAVDLKSEFSQFGKRPQAVITLVPPPPGYVSFADIQPYADVAEEHQIIPGLGRPTKKFSKGEPVTLSATGDSPMFGLSIGSGGGKSVAARNAACQFAHHGCLIATLDTKLISQHWCAGLRNVAYARTPAELHELAIWLAGEVDRRNQVALFAADVEGEVHAHVGPRIIGILEELNATQAVLQAYWRDELGGKGKSPAVLALDKVSFTGRQVLVNLIYIGQRLSAKAISGGSGDARDNIGVWFTRNPVKRTWDLLGLGDRHALPPATDVDGRLQIATAKEVIEVQGAFVTGKQAREYATSGIVAVPPAGMPCVGGLAPVGTAERLAQDVPDMPALPGHGPDLHVVRDSPGQPPQLPPRITIPEAVAEGISGPTYDAVRKDLARRRRKGEPVPVPVGVRGNADEYDRIEWCDWEETRRQPRRLVR
jgi:hypothetical protein